MADPATADTGKIEVVGLPIWTPGRDGRGDEERYTGRVHAKKAAEGGSVLTGYSRPQAVGYAAKHGGLVPSSGLWYQTRARLEAEGNPVEKDFITGPLEDTATLFRVLRVWRNYADCLLIQYPLLNAEGTDSVRDERGIPRAKQIWQTALPVSSEYFAEMSPDFAVFANILFGTDDAQRKLPFARFYLGKAPVPGEERRVLRSSWGWAPKDRRVDVNGALGPSARHSDVGFRVFEGGEDSIREVDARRRRLIVEA